MKDDPKNKSLLGAVMVAAVLGSLCCIIPLLFAGAGAAAVVLAGKFAILRPYLLAATGLLLVAGFYFAYRPLKSNCEPGAACAIPANRRRARLGLWLAAVFAVGLTTFPYWSAALVRSVGQKSSPTALQAGVSPVKTTLHVSGMMCDVCAANIENTLRAQAGVRSAHVNFSKSAAEVEYNPSRITLPQIRSVVEKAGYQVKIVKPDTEAGG